MSFFKALFGGKDTATPEEKKEAERTRNFDILKYDGVRAMQTGRAEYAILCFNHALDIKDDMETRDYLSQAMIHTGNIEGAYGQLEILAGAFPANTAILARMAHVAFMLEDYSSMTDICEKALQYDNADTDILNLYARALVAQGNDSKAIEKLDCAIEADGRQGNALLMRGELLLKAKDFEKAEADIEKLMSLAPENEDVIMLKARYEKARGNYDEAIGFYNKVTDINPFRTEAYAERGETKLLAGDEEGGNRDIAEAGEMGTANVTGNGDIEQKTKDSYRNINPLGI